jgi:electron transport complex protein RnfC
VVTLTGEALQQPGNVEALIGTPISYLLAQAGLQPEQLNRLVLGGPMMGYTLHSDEVPVVKTSNCVIAATARELPAPPPEQPCIRCGQCALACPMELLPQQLFWYAKAAEFEKAEHLNLFDCIECGACSYVCPSSIPLVQYYRYAKGEIRQQRAEQLKADRARERFEARQARLDREQQEKKQRRKERAKAAAEAQATKQAEAEQVARQGEAVDDRAAKAALVQQALERKKAKAARATAEAAHASASPAREQSSAPAAAPAGPGQEDQPLPDLEALEKQLMQAQGKLDTMQGMLEEARAQHADNVDKLERAVAKNHDRVQRAEQALADARKVLAEQTGSAASE